MAPNPTLYFLTEISTSSVFKFRLSCSELTTSLCNDYVKFNRIVRRNTVFFLFVAQTKGPRIFSAKTDISTLDFMCIRKLVESLTYDFFYAIDIFE